MCPGCLATYAKVLSALGIGLELSETHHLWLLLGCITLSLGFGAREVRATGRAGPMVVTSAGCAVLLAVHVIGENIGMAPILDLIEGADLVVYDSTYTDEEFALHRGWGHSTWEEGVRLCRSAGARRLAIFHHDPDHDDAFMDRVAHEAKERWSGAFVAREGTTIEIAR